MKDWRKKLIEEYDIKIRVVSNMLLDCPKESIERLTTKLICYKEFVKSLKQHDNDVKYQESLLEYLKNK